MWSEKIMVNCDFICGADEKMVWFACSLTSGIQVCRKLWKGILGTMVTKPGIIELCLDTENHKNMYSYRDTGIYGS